MTDAFYFGSEVDWEPTQPLGPEDPSIYEFLTHPEDPLDYRFGASHMLILDRLPAVTHNHAFQGVDDPAVIPGGSTKTPIYGNEASQSPRYWEHMQTPQSTTPGSSMGICPHPTHPPSGPNMNSQPSFHSCDHATCIPPPDVGFLSRRFVENEDWIRARAAAVASLAHRKRGCKSL